MYDSYYAEENPDAGSLALGALVALVLVGGAVMFLRKSERDDAEEAKRKKKALKAAAKAGAAKAKKAKKGMYEKYRPLIEQALISEGFAHHVGNYEITKGQPELIPMRGRMAESPGPFGMTDTLYLYYHVPGLPRPIRFQVHPSGNAVAIDR